MQFFYARHPSMQEGKKVFVSAAMEVTPSAPSPFAVD
jgi:hypothetical protein